MTAIPSISQSLPEVGQVQGVLGTYVFSGPGTGVCSLSGPNKHVWWALSCFYPEDPHN